MDYPFNNECVNCGVYYTGSGYCLFDVTLKFSEIRYSTMVFYLYFNGNVAELVVYGKKQIIREFNICNYSIYDIKNFCIKYIKNSAFI